MKAVFPRPKLPVKSVIDLIGGNLHKTVTLELNEPIRVAVEISVRVGVGTGVIRGIYYENSINSWPGPS